MSVKAELFYRKQQNRFYAKAKKDITSKASVKGVSLWRKNTVQTNAASKHKKAY
jgi:hypothetical protein